MVLKALITRRGAPRSAAMLATEAADAKSAGLSIETEHPQGILVAGDDAQLQELEAQGYRVKILPDANLIKIGSHMIDTEQEPQIEAIDDLDVPAELRADWYHHLVQLAGPPNSDWIRKIEDLGADVVEPISGYGLFVVVNPEKAKDLRELPFVSWVNPFKPDYRIASELLTLEGKIQNVSVGVYPSRAVGSVKEALEKLGGTLVNQWKTEGPYHDSFAVLLVELDADKLQDVANLPPVRWLEYLPPGLQPDDERSCQIVAENLDAAAPPNTAPVTGYYSRLVSVGLSGAGILVGVCDTGVDTHDSSTMHPDLSRRLRFFEDATGGQTTTDRNGHGTHVAGIAVGNGSTGDADPQGFVLGQGVAPKAEFGVVNAVDTPGGPGTDPLDRFTKAMAHHGAHVMNNSWRQGGSNGYTSGAALLDGLVRKPSSVSSSRDNLVIVFSAGNDGPVSGSITPPKEAKNPITVGNLVNYRPNEGHHRSANTVDIRGVGDSSSRGPAADGRILPTIVAPGTDIVSARSSAASRQSYTDTSGKTHTKHTLMTGTSMAAPHVTGLCALLVQWWKARFNGAQPSPALVKAWLINGAEDMAGGPDGKGGTLGHIPNNDQGWGRVSLRNMVQDAPESHRGPKLFYDQSHAFTAAGNERQLRIRPEDPGRPLRITLVWTDAPGGVNTSPALVNDLDLEVEELATQNVYKGNVFQQGFSVIGGNFDSLNNVECVFIRNPQGEYNVNVICSVLKKNARDPDKEGPLQDYALVIDNAVEI